MNFLKKILGYPAGDPSSQDPASEVLSFSGEAALLTYYEGQKSEIFKKALVKFLPNTEKLFNYSIYVKNLGKPQPELSMEYNFPVHSNMNLKSFYENDPEEMISFIWNLDQTNTLCLVFYNENNGLPMAVLFKEFLCRCIFETIHGKSYVNAASDNDYLKFCKDVSVPGEEKKAVVEINLQPSASSKKKPQSSEPKEDPVDLTKLLPDFASKKGTLLCNSGSYHSMDSDETLILQSPSVIFVLSDDGAFKYSFSLYNGQKKQLYKKAVNSELNFHIDEKSNIFKWLDFSNSSFQLLLVRFNSFECTKNLRYLINQCLFECNTKVYFKDAMKKGEEHEMAERFIRQLEMEIEPEVVQEYKTEVFNISDSCSRIHNRKEDMENRTFSQAKVLDRTFLNKGGVVSVFKTDDDDENQLEFICDLPELKTLGNKTLLPRKMLLQEEDTKVLILNETDQNKVFYMDIEKGKVVSELQVDQANSVMDIAPESKHSNLTHDPIFLALNSKNLFKVDPRLNPKQAACLSKIYTTNYQFNTITSNEKGNFAVGNEQGQIRLYKDMGQNAKNLYPGLGERILSLDCTKDGRWLLGTCKTYLVFVAAFSKERNAFEYTIKNAEKPTAQMLKILPKDMLTFGIKEVTFENGRFDDHEAEKEEGIVAACGNLLVTWSLKSVITGNIYDYKIKKMAGKIVNNEFKFNDRDKLLLALPSELRMHQTQGFKH